MPRRSPTTASMSASAGSPPLAGAGSAPTPAARRPGAGVTSRHRRRPSSHPLAPADRSPSTPARRVRPATSASNAAATAGCSATASAWVGPARTATSRWRSPTSSPRRSRQRPRGSQPTIGVPGDMGNFDDRQQGNSAILDNSYYVSPVLTYADTTAPAVPTGVTPSVGPNSVTLNWDQALDTQGDNVTLATSYTVYRGSTQIGTTDADMTVLNDNGLDTGSYSYTVKATDYC